MMLGYIAVIGLSFLPVLQALNITEELENITQSSIYVQNDKTTWFEGLQDCQKSENGSIEAYKYLENKTFIADLVDIHGPLWTYGMEVVASRSGKQEVFRIYQKHPDLIATCVCWGTIDPFMSVEPKRTYNEAERWCNSKKFSLPSVNSENITSYNRNIIVNSPFWLHSIQERLFLEASDIKVRCFIYDVDGILKTEDCKSEHKTLCVAENAFPVVEFVNNVTLPRLQKKTTKGTTSTKSISTKSRDTKNDSSLSSSSSNSTTPPSSPRSNSVFMDPQIQYTVIGVGSAIVISIVVAIIICCCKRKKKKSPEKKRKSTQLADNYSETVDSMAMKEQSIYETPNNSEYATPEDAIRKARQRQSIGENEYDVINSEPQKKKPTGGVVHAYNHVTLVSTKDRQNNSELDENQYDVTNYGRQATVLIAPNDKIGNEYGHVSIKVER